MVEINGKEFSIAELREYTGALNQIAGIKSYTFNDGKARGVRGMDVKTGSGFEFTVLPDRGLDIAWTSYRGISLCHMSKNGIVSDRYYEPAKDGWLRNYFGGMLTTCGLSNTGSSCHDEGRDFGMHGRINNTPASNVNVSEVFGDDEYHIMITGKIAETEFYSENIELNRTIETWAGSSRLVITDKVTNFGYRSEPLMLLYHFNAGFPLLDENTELLLNPDKTDYFDEAAAAGMNEMFSFQKPTSGYFRQVFLHKLKKGADNRSVVALINKSLRDYLMGIYLRFSSEELPEFFEFKMMGQGDYQLGLEPSNCLPMGRAVERERKGLKFIEPGETKIFSLELGVIRTDKEADKLRAEIMEQK